MTLYVSPPEWHGATLVELFCDSLNLWWARIDECERVYLEILHRCVHCKYIRDHHSSLHTIYSVAECNLQRGCVALLLIECVRGYAGFMSKRVSTASVYPHSHSPQLIDRTRHWRCRRIYHQPMLECVSSLTCILHTRDTRRTRTTAAFSAIYLIISRTYEWCACACTCCVKSPEMLAPCTDFRVEHLLRFYISLDTIGMGWDECVCIRVIERTATCIACGIIEHKSDLTKDKKTSASQLDSAQRPGYTIGTSRLRESNMPT